MSNGSSTPSAFKRIFVGDDDSYATQVPADDLFHAAGPYGPIFAVSSNSLRDQVKFDAALSENWFSAGTGVSAGVGWVSTTSAALLVSGDGTVGFAAASRASDVPFSLGTTQISIPFVGIAVMDRTGSGPPYWTSYGGYFEARMEPVSAAIGTVIGIEIDAINFGSVVTQATPWVRQTTGGATALWLASGGDPANHGRAISPAQLAIGIVNNGETFTTGIAFANDAIEGTDGVSGFGDAAALSVRHILGWWAGTGGAGTRVSYITSTATEVRHSLQFQDGGTLLLGAAGSTDFSVSNVASSVNGIGIVPAVASSSPYIETFGSDAAPNLDIKPKGAGNLRLFASTLLFMSDAGAQHSYVNSTVTSNTYEQGLVFSDSGPFFYGRGAVVMGFAQQASAVNYIEARNAVTTVGPGFYVVGADTNIPLHLEPKGTGQISIVTPESTSANIGGASALPALPQGYVTLTINGTSRKIAYWNT